jgi:hypothetical protein
VDLAARRQVSEALGHSRTQITSVYLGSSAVMRSNALKPSEPPMT